MQTSNNVERVEKVVKIKKKETQKRKTSHDAANTDKQFVF